jgi:hypothetical protein
MLAWLGADVIQIERPPHGDRARRLWNMDNPELDSFFFLLLNSNKRSTVVNLRTEEGKDIARRLIQNADIVAENLGPGVMERLGLGWEAVKALNPRAIYASVKGFGSYGPYSGFKCFEPVAQATSGAMSVTGEADGPPIVDGANLGDSGTGMRLTIAIRCPGTAARHRPQPARRGRDAGGRAEPDPGQVHPDPRERQTARTHRQPLGHRRLVRSPALRRQRVQRLRLHDHPARQSGDVRRDDRGDRALGSARRRPLCDTAGARSVEIAGPERAPFNEIVTRYLKAVGDPREVVSDPEARYFGGREDREDAGGRERCRFVDRCAPADRCRWPMSPTSSCCATPPKTRRMQPRRITRNRCCTYHCDANLV